MGGGTGNIRTLRNQSGTVGSRTLVSILASSGCGAGSLTRVYAFYNRQNNPKGFYSMYESNSSVRNHLFLKF